MSGVDKLSAHETSLTSHKLNPFALVFSSVRIATIPTLGTIMETATDRAVSGIIVKHVNTNLRAAYHYGFSIIITEIDLRLWQYGNCSCITEKS